MRGDGRGREDRRHDAAPLAIHLLGPPRIEIDARPAAPLRGRKAWGLLAFLLRSDRPVSRERLAGLLFAEADDPLGTLRWNLAELRRALGAGVELGGDPVRLVLPPHAWVDVRALDSGTLDAAVSVPGIGQELLEGVDVQAGAAFEAWLLAERRRVAGLSAAILREAATSRLAAGDAAAAIRLATTLVSLDEFDEEAHGLLVRAYLAAGSTADARRHLDATVARFRRDLGVEPSSALLRSVEGRAPSRPPAGIVSAAAVESLIAAGEAAVAAGVLEAGLDILRRAAADARDVADPRLEARALLALGEALVHGGWSTDGDAATALHAAVARAGAIGAADIVAEACRELGYVELKHARYDRAEAWLARAVAAAPDRDSRAAAIGVWGAVTCDQGRTGAAIGQLREADADARALDKPRLEAWALTFLGRGYLLREEWSAARASLTRAVDVVRSARWLTFLPFPQALLATVDLAEGRVAEAREAFESAFALGCQIGDPCWEGISARGIGLVHSAEGRIDDAIRWLSDAQTRCIRVPDAYLWIHAYCLDALCEVAIASDAPDAAARASDLESVAARTGMHELLVRAHLHRAALGEPGAAEAARLFSDRIDNPAVLRRVAALGASELAPVAIARAKSATAARSRRGVGAPTGAREA